MQICKVIGSVVSTRKNEALTGCRFLIVEPKNAALFVAVDNIGAGVGETVLVVTGCAARVACGSLEVPTDAAIVGIVDEGSK